MMKTIDNIEQYIKEKEQVTVNELVRYFGLSKQTIHKHLNNLLLDKKVTKVGTPPKVYYQFLEFKKEEKVSVNIPKQYKEVIEDNFLNITPSGNFLSGVHGFVSWCNDRKVPVSETATQYIKILKKYDSYKKGDFIDGMYKLKKTFKEVFLDEIFYIDFYAIEIFGKTKLGQMLLYAKQSQNIKMMQAIIKDIKPKIEELIKKENIDAIGFIPPTIKRATQFMKEIERGLNINLPIIRIEKIKTEVVVPQKTLTKLEDRIKNAEHTMALRETRNFKKVLLLDDALGSGATLNEVARKLKKARISHEVIGLAITGSFSGFEIINEV